MDTPRPVIFDEGSPPDRLQGQRTAGNGAELGSTEALGQVPQVVAGLGSDAAVRQAIDPFATPAEPDEAADTVIRRSDGGSSARVLGRGSSASPAEVAKVLLGSRLSHFHLEELIGGGGMGAVFRARDERLDRTVAIKVIPFIGDDPDMQRRFRNEAQAAARLDHPNIARVFDVGMSEGWRYIVFEYIQGTNIRDLIERDGVLSIDDAVFYTRQIAEALHHASGRGVVHRDVKPSNVLVNTEGETKLVDMGLARSDQLELSGDMTASGVTLGTFDYISPEQARDPRDADVRSDLYSLGCTLYFMLTGQPPYPGGTVLQKLLNHGNAPPPDPTAERPNVSGDLKAILFKMLAKSPDARYQRAIDLVADLRELADRESLVRARSQGTLTIPREDLSATSWANHLPWLVAAAVLLLGGVFLQLVDSLRADTLNLEIPPSAVILRQAGGIEAFQGPPPSDAEGATENRAGASAIPAASVAGPSLAQPPTPPTAVVGEALLETPSERQSTVGPVSDELATVAVEGLVVPTPAPSGGGRPSAAVDPEVADVALVGPRFSEIAMPREPVSLPGVEASVDPKAVPKIEKVIVGPGGSVWPDNAVRVETLADALVKADDLGINTIEIAVPLVDSPPLRIPRDGLTIRSSVGTSEIRFIADQPPAMERAVMVDIGSHRVDFQNLHFTWQVRGSAIEGGALFSLTSNRLVRLTGCTVTVENSAQRDEVFAFEILGTANSRPAIGDLLSDPFSLRPGIDATSPLAVDDNKLVGRTTSPIRLPMPPLVAIELNQVACRGEMTLINLVDAVQMQFRWDNGLLAVSGRMLEVAGVDTPVSTGGVQIQILLSRVTASTGDGLVRTRLGPSGIYPMPIDRDCRSVVFRSPLGAPHVEFVGLASGFGAIDGLINLRGEDNAYDLEPEGDWPILDLALDGGEKQVFWMSQMLGPSRPPWAADRSPLWVVRWSSPLDDLIPASQMTAEDFYQDGTVVPGFDRDTLPNFPPRRPLGQNGGSDSTPGQE